MAKDYVAEVEKMGIGTQNPSGKKKKKATIGELIASRLQQWLAQSENPDLYDSTGKAYENSRKRAIQQSVLGKGKGK
jgi:hypothetical protein